MMKRLAWFVGGAAAGVTGVGLAKRKVKSVAEELAPANVVKKARARVRDAYQEGRRAMKAKEAELRARVNGDVSTLADELGDGDSVIVDGVPVEPGQVIVLRQVREARQQPGPRRRA